MPGRLSIFSSVCVCSCVLCVDQCIFKISCKVLLPVLGTSRASRAVKTEAVNLLQEGDATPF